MLIIIPAIMLIAFLIWAFSHPNNDSRYEQSHNYIDFDPGKDSGKVGDSEYPNAGLDSVMKQELIDDLNSET